MNFLKFTAVIASIVLAAGTLGACGNPSEGGSAAAASEGASPGGASSGDASSGTEKDSSRGAYLKAALEILSEAENICASGAVAAENLRQATDDLYRLTEDPDAESSTGISNEEEYIAYGDEQLADVSDERDRLAALSEKLDGVSFSGDGVLKEIKERLSRTFGQMDASFLDMEQLVGFFRDSNEIYSRTLSAAVDSYDADDTAGYITNVYQALKDLQSEYRSMAKPAQIKEIWDKNADNIDLFASSLQFISNYNVTDGAAIYYYSFNEMNNYNSAVEASYTMQLLSVITESFDQDEYMFSKAYPGTLSSLKKSCENGTSPEDTAAPDPDFDFEITGEIYPNRYPSMDSVVNLKASTTVPKQDVIISAEIKGFTQAYEQKVTLTQQTAYFCVKPPLLTELPDLSTRRDTQLTFKITDNETGKTLVQESRNVTLYSIYDFFIETDEFGSASVYDLLGWLRPESNAVDIVNRQAVSYLESVVGVGMLTGYNASYSENPDLNTLVQVAAIQKAISDLGIRYTMDPYSFSGAQHILTPDQVVAKKTGLCIESSLLMASCLMKANLHPLIILTPGHAQVAVESYVGADGSSGIYYLIETTDIPYGGFTVTESGVDFGDLVLNTSDPSSSWWNDYLSGKSTEDGYPFVIDCDLRSVMHIQGLENVQADIDIVPVEYDPGDIPRTDGSGNSGSGGSGSGDSGSGDSGSGTSHGSGSNGSDGDSEYTTVTNGDGDLTIIVKSDAETALDGNILTVYPVAGADTPVMNLIRVYDMDADSYLNRWIDNLKESGYAVELPTEISSTSFDTLNFSFIGYYTTSDNVTYYQNMVAAVPLEDGSLVIFELIAEDGDDDGLAALNEAFATALYTFL